MTDEDPMYEVPLSRLNELTNGIETLSSKLAELTELHNDLVDDLLANCPESYEASEGSPEAIAISYVRDLEKLRDGIWESLPNALKMFR
jgi:X-X-X-Leu-X-X-Gly heptad repeat protein